MKLIGITGAKRSGKDSLATIIQEESNEKWERISFADPMREIMYSICDYNEKNDTRSWNGYNYEEHKEKKCLVLDISKSFSSPILIKVLSYNTQIKEELLDNVNRFMKFIYQFQNRVFSPREFLQKLGTEFGREVLGPNVWVNTLLSSLEEGKKYIIPDVRFDNEAKAIIEAGGLIIKTVRTGMKTEIKDLHKSEVGIQDNFVTFTVEALDLVEMRNKLVERIRCGDLDHNK